MASLELLGRKSLFRAGADGPRLASLLLRSPYSRLAAAASHCPAPPRSAPHKHRLRERSSARDTATRVDAHAHQTHPSLRRWLRESHSLFHLLKDDRAQAPDNCMRPARSWGEPCPCRWPPAPQGRHTPQPSTLPMHHKTPCQRERPARSHVCAPLFLCAFRLFALLAAATRGSAARALTQREATVHAAIRGCTPRL